MKSFEFLAKWAFDLSQSEMPDIEGRITMSGFCLMIPGATTRLLADVIYFVMHDISPKASYIVMNKRSVIEVFGWMCARSVSEMDSSRDRSNNFSSQAPDLLDVVIELSRHGKASIRTVLIFSESSSRSQPEFEGCGGQRNPATTVIRKGECSSFKFKLSRKMLYAKEGERTWQARQYEGRFAGTWLRTDFLNVVFWRHTSTSDI